MINSCRRDPVVSIRQAISEDIQQMCGLLSELFSIEQNFSPDTEKQSTGLRLLINSQSGLSVVLVAEKDREIIGMCSLQTVISTAEGGIAGLLEDLIVRRDFRGNGIGLRLLTEILAWCKTRGISRVQLLRDADNEEARNFYIREGWRDTKLLCMRMLL